MPGSLRHPRAAGAALVVALAGAPLLASLPAGAAAPAAQPETGAQIRFRGGPLGLGILFCRSDPDQGALTVPAGATVTFVNHTRRPATLLIDGAVAGTARANQALPVVFHRGSVTVAMVPSCGFNLNRVFGAVTVEVTPAPADAAGPAGAFLIGNPHAAATGKVTVAEAVTATSAPGGANGLVALIAAVCVAGTTTSAIRAILAQHASRTLDA